MFTSGQRVKFVGIHGRTDGPTGRISRVCRGYVRVRWDGGNVEQVHPQDIRPV